MLTLLRLDNGAIRELDPAIGQVRVIMMVLVDGKRAGGFRAEQCLVLRVNGNTTWCPATTDMAIQADNLIGGCHDQMQVVRN